MIYELFSSHVTQKKLKYHSVFLLFEKNYEGEFVKSFYSGWAKYRIFLTYFGLAVYYSLNSFLSLFRSELYITIVGIGFSTVFFAVSAIVLFLKPEGKKSYFFEFFISIPLPFLFLSNYIFYSLKITDYTIPCEVITFDFLVFVGVHPRIVIVLLITCVKNVVFLFIYIVLCTSGHVQFGSYYQYMEIIVFFFMAECMTYVLLYLLERRVRGVFQFTKALGKQRILLEEEFSKTCHLLYNTFPKVFSLKDMEIIDLRFRRSSHRQGIWGKSSGRSGSGEEGEDDDNDSEEPKVMVTEQENVTVVVANLVNFSKIAADYKPRELVFLLNYYLVEFNKLCKKLKLHPIRTKSGKLKAVGYCGDPDVEMYSEEEEGESDVDDSDDDSYVVKSRKEKKLTKNEIRKMNKCVLLGIALIYFNSKMLIPNPYMDSEVEKRGGKRKKGKRFMSKFDISVEVQFASRVHFSLFGNFNTIMNCTMYIPPDCTSRPRVQKLQPNVIRVGEDIYYPTSGQFDYIVDDEDDVRLDVEQQGIKTVSNQFLLQILSEILDDRFENIGNTAGLEKDSFCESSFCSSVYSVDNSESDAFVKEQVQTQIDGQNNAKVIIKLPKQGLVNRNGLVYGLFCYLKPKTFFNFEKYKRKKVRFLWLILCNFCFLSLAFSIVLNELVFTDFYAILIYVMIVQNLMFCVFFGCSNCFPEVNSLCALISGVANIVCWVVFTSAVDVKVMDFSKKVETINFFTSVATSFVLLFSGMHPFLELLFFFIVMALRIFYTQGRVIWSNEVYMLLSFAVYAFSAETFSLKVFEKNVVFDENEILVKELIKKNYNLVLTFSPSTFLQQIMSKREEYKHNKNIMFHESSVCSICSFDIGNISWDRDDFQELIQSLSSFFFNIELLARKRGYEVVKSFDRDYLVFSLGKDVDQMVEFAEKTKEFFFEIFQNKEEEQEEDNKRTINESMQIGIHQGEIILGLVVSNYEILNKVFGDDYQIVKWLCENSDPNSIHVLKSVYDEFLGPKKCEILKENQSEIAKGRKILSYNVEMKKSIITTAVK